MEMKGMSKTTRVARMEEDAFKLNAEDFTKEAVIIREEDLVGILEEIEKLDAVLKIKLTEEKKAKLSRIQMEEESRDVLSNLPNSKMSERVKVNVDQFVKLLNEVERTADSSQRFRPNDVDGVGGEGPDNKEGGKEGKTSCQHANSLTFVERNILLAKCGRGTLSLTDEEKSRLENLLIDVEEPELKTAVQTVSEIKEEFYGIDRDTKSILGEIDEQLEVLEKLKTGRRHEKGADPFEKIGTEKNALDDKGKQSYNRGREQEKKKKWNRLEEINKLLNSMNCASDEEIIPLPQEELESLIELSKRNLSAGKGSESEEGGEQPNPKLPRQVIADLVSGAKFLMPKFKYRFDEE